MTLKEVQKSQDPHWELAQREVHSTQSKIEAYQLNHLESTVINHSNLKLALHNKHVLIRKQANSSQPGLSLGIYWELLKKYLHLHSILSGLDLIGLCFSLVIRTFKRLIK